MGKTEQTSQMKNELYLLVLSILLGISILKLPEVFQFASHLKDTLKLYTTDFSVIHVIILISIAGYIIFFIYVTLAGYNIVQQLQNPDAQKSLPEAGPIIAGCIIALTVTYLLVFSVAIYSAIGR